MSIQIKDNKEPLVDIKKYCPGIIIDIDKPRMKKEKTAYVRRTVAKMLHKAQTYLPNGWNFIIGDAWRPAYVQISIFYGFIKRFTKEHPDWTKKRVVQEANKFVAPWKEIDASGHMTGGALDLRLIDKKGRKIPMKCRKLTYQQNALPNPKLLPTYIRNNRKILFSAMEKAGFSNCSNEYWHWSYGDYWWAKRYKKSIAIYGIIKDSKHFYDNDPCPCGSGKKYKHCCGKNL